MTSSSCRRHAVIVATRGASDKGRLTFSLRANIDASRESHGLHRLSALRAFRVVQKMDANFVRQVGAFRVDQFHLKRLPHAIRLGGSLNCRWFAFGQAASDQGLPNRASAKLTDRGSQATRSNTTAATATAPSAAR